MSKTRSSPQETGKPAAAAERADARDRGSPSALVVHEAIRLQGSDELSRSRSSLAWSGLAAGLSMGLSLVGEGLILRHLPAAEWTDLVASFGYTLGFLVVVLGRQQLFTESTLSGVVPVLHERTLDSVRRLARLWGIVFVANILGTLLFAVAAARTNMFDAATRQVFLEIGLHAAEPGFATTFVRAVPAGWLIALMVWLLPAAGSARFLVIVTLSYFVALGDLSHVIAGSAEVAYAAIAGPLSWGEYVTRFLLPTLFGNTLGGSLLVAALNHAQVHKDS